LKCDSDLTGGSFTIDVYSSFGAPSFSLNGGDNSSSNTFSDLVPGTYSVTVTDSSCSVVVPNITITRPPPITYTYDSTMPPCYRQATGTLTVQAYGGYGDFEYVLNTRTYSTTGNFTKLLGGNHTWSISDARNCKNSGWAFIDDYPPMSTATNMSEPLCKPDGSLTKSYVIFGASGGVPPYQYSLNGSYTSQNAYYDVPVGQYSWGIQDSNGCRSEGGLGIFNPNCSYLTLSGNGGSSSGASSFFPFVSLVLFKTQSCERHQSMHKIALYLPKYLKPYV